MIWIIIATVWLLCGFLSYGLAKAEIRRILEHNFGTLNNPLMQDRNDPAHYWDRRGYNWRDEIWCWLAAIFSPFYLLLMAVVAIAPASPHDLGSSEISEPRGKLCFRMPKKLKDGRK